MCRRRRRCCLSDGRPMIEQLNEEQEWNYTGTVAKEEERRKSCRHSSTEKKNNKVYIEDGRRQSAFSRQYPR